VALLVATWVLVLVLAHGAGQASARAVKKGFWGPSQVNGVSQFPIYRDLGVDLYQTQLRWDTAAPTRPENPADPADPAYRWPAELDYVLAEAERHRMGVLIMLIGTPPWANGGQAWQWAPESEYDFAQFAEAAARRYPQVRHWMIWGEPSRAANFQPLAQQRIECTLTPEEARPAQRYARMLNAAYGALKDVSPRNKVIGGNTSTINNIAVYNWIGALRLPDGSPPRMDLYGHNPFTIRKPDLRNRPLPYCEADYSDLARVSSAVHRNLRRGRRSIPLFLSEFTIPTDAEDREFNFHVTRAVQARWLRAAFDIANGKVKGAPPIYGLGWIHLYDEPPKGAEPVSHGGLLTATGGRKPAYYVFKRAP